MGSGSPPGLGVFEVFGGFEASLARSLSLGFGGERFRILGVLRVFFVSSFL